MVDFDKMIDYLEYLKNKPTFIKRGEVYTNDEVEKLKVIAQQYAMVDFDKIFEKTTQENCNDMFLVEIVCPNCNKKYYSEIGVSKFKKYIKGKKINSDFYCCECENIMNEKNKNNIQEQKEKREEQVKKGIEYFTKELLSPNSNFNKEIPHTNRLAQCKYYSDLFVKNEGQKALSQFIYQLGYKDYLTTAYWKTISLHAKHNANYKCQLCGKESKLVTHHNTYEHIGNEISHLDDLICICEKCHEKHHFE